MSLFLSTDTAISITEIEPNAYLHARVGISFMEFLYGIWTYYIKSNIILRI